MDEYGNYVETGDAVFRSILINKNVTGLSYGHESQAHLGTGIYELKYTLYKIGYYTFNIYLKDGSNQFQKIAGSPFWLWVYPNDPYPETAIVSGSGVKGVLIGRIEEIYLKIRDQYENDYNKAVFQGKSVYYISVVSNETDIIPVNLT